MSLIERGLGYPSWMDMHCKQLELDVGYCKLLRSTRLTFRYHKNMNFFFFVFELLDNKNMLARMAKKNQSVQAFFLPVCSFSPSSNETHTEKRGHKQSAQNTPAHSHLECTSLLSHLPNPRPRPRILGSLLKAMDPSILHRPLTASPCFEVLAER